MPIDRGLLVFALLLAGGCGGNATAPNAVAPKGAAQKPVDSLPRLIRSPGAVPAAPQVDPAEGTPFDPSAPVTKPGKVSETPVAAPPVPVAGVNPQQFVALPPVDENRAAAAGIRKIVGKHVTVYTDLPKGPDVDELPALFDQAIPQWCEYFGIDPAKAAKWQVRAFVMDRKERFQGAGLMPDNLPPFPFGFMRDNQFWQFEQPSAYYRRHLFLHEGTHAFMFHFLGDLGPPWYSEGMAELFGTHSWKEGRLVMRHFPVSREETPDWGRIKVVRDDFAAAAGLNVDRVMAFGNLAHRETGPYAWSWALCAFLDNHPRYQAAFRQMREAVIPQHAFNRRLREALGPENMAALDEEWQIFVAQVDYGYDVARSAVEFKRGVPLPAAGATATIAAAKSWQSSGFRLVKGETYQINAQGQFTVGKLPKPWICEPPGVTIRYHQGRPLGMLLAAVREEASDGRLTGLLDVAPIGAGASFTAPRNGTLYLKINEFSGGLADNEGSLSASIKR